LAFTNISFFYFSIGKEGREGGREGGGWGSFLLLKAKK
jgi:hypothetical protein